MKSQYIRSFFVALFLFPLILNAQESSLTQFKTSKSIGKAPVIFTTSFDDKVAAKIESTNNIKDDDKEEYARYTNYALNSLLQSGLVLYGDPMTVFVEKVAAKLLANEPNLEKELQFYVIKSNITNALCTDPGVIFITTGLISQIENEAQLAYIIAHEIVHYQEKHLEESFNKSKETNLEITTSYEDLVLLSKDHEFEADANALKLYHAAGYSDKEINTVFDVLMYSYLTFDEVKIDNSFFGNPEVYIPESYFPEKANPILAFEEYDDSKSTHPNIRRRKDAIANEIEKYSDWENNSHFIETEEFSYVQNIARFESVRENLLRSDYIKSLYEIYILEKEFPKNEFLQTSKALAWLFMSQTNLSGKKRSFIKKIDEKEGSISMVYSFLSKLSSEEMALMAVRQTHDIHKEFPSSKRIKEIRDEAISALAHVRRFDINKLEKISYLDAIKLREEYLTDTVQTDTLAIEGESKYDKIKRIRAKQSSTKSTTELIDENFSAFLLYDLVGNREFNEIYEKEIEKIKNEKGYTSLSKKERKQLKKERNKKLEGDIILITPQLEANYKGNFDLDKTLLFYDIMVKEIPKYAPTERVYDNSIALAEDFTTEKYNEACLINSYLVQKINLNNGEFKDQIIDYEDMQGLIKKFNNPYLVLISGEANKSSIFRNSLSGKAQYIEISTGNVLKSNYYSVNLKIRKASVGGLVFEVFSKF
ncbi:hypothetical protein ERX46_01395 [Brumimicrobium glaciale]|uniref:Peptidase M48 domain-containing protein n=1 Tax=Brumimicrobium glaciale TaxID=200475 RepID=A0A4Q4KU76_9FLAO|nr:M48 family metallopeptidase [Brumimicrobium glaciale]RYM35674.1 hypothetical protein ERX46_01395 [Brumimicrobium glaciale]